MHATPRTAHGVMAPDSGDTAFIIISSVLVLMMTLPGLMLFYGGLSGFKGVLSTSIQTMAIASLISICWLMFGYSLAFGSGKGNQFIGGSEKFWFIGSGEDYAPVKTTSLVGTIPETVFIMFQLTFAIITAAITAGSYAERMKFSSMLIFFALWHFLVYCPVAHWVWGGGFLMKWGVLDFAGGNVVHIVSGVSGVVGSVILGPREHDAVVRSEHTELLTFIGGSLLWVGWFGFNAGSALTAGGSAGMAMLVTHICASTSAFTWMVVEWVRTGKPTVIGVVSGAITGLVIITPAAGFVDQTGAFVMGLVGAVASYLLVMVKNSLGMDEKPNTSLYPDAFGVHAIAGILGGFMTGLFANPAVAGVSGAFYQNGEQLGWQLLGMLITIGWTALLTAVLLFALKFTIGINAEQEVPQKLPVAEEHPLQPAMHVLPASNVPMMMMPPQQQFQPGFYAPFAVGSA